MVAQALLRGIERRQAYILPGLDTRLFFLLVSGPNGLNSLVSLIRWYFVDRVVAKVRREREAERQYNLSSLSPPDGSQLTPDNSQRLLAGARRAASDWPTDATKGR